MARFPSWHFREMDRGEINVDPVHDEFFKAQDLADALVRESIQNSLDARRGNSKVHVRFRFSSDDRALAPAIAQRYLAGLEPHLPAGAADLAGAMPFLVVEDSGTRGLVGDPGEDPELDADGWSGSTRNDFYYFWRNVGRSGKGELDRGRWGLGKAVFPVSSRIRTMFGLTFRADDGQRLLLGQSVVKTHILDGKRHAPYGFFAHVGSDSFPHAIDDPPLIDRFITDFGLQRDEPGLSIVVPFHRHDDLRFDGIVQSVIRQYFYPIIRNDLMVTVEENGTSEPISARTIEEVAARHGMDDGLARLCKLTRTSVLLEEHEWITIPEPAAAGAPKWRADAIAAGQLERLRQRFEEGDVLAFRVSLPVRRKRSRAASSHFSVVLEKDESLRRGEHHFIRRGITIPEVRSTRDKPVRALLVTDDDALSTFLGDAENPAHSDWSERNDKIRMLYENGASTLRYVKNAISTIASMLAMPPAGRAPDLLADIFSVTVPSEATARGLANRRGEAESTPGNRERIGIKAPEQTMRIEPVSGGFRLIGTGQTTGSDIPLIAEMAYRTRNGNPFRKYSPFDFTLGEGAIQVEAEGVTIRSREANRIEMITTRPHFEVALTGFDRRRDLVVRVSRKGNDAPEAELH
jgi:hypothetical protein